MVTADPIKSCLAYAAVAGRNDGMSIMTLLNLPCLFRHPVYESRFPNTAMAWRLGKFPNGKGRSGF